MRIFITILSLLFAGAAARAALKVAAPDIQGIPIVSPAGGGESALTLTNDGDMPESGRFTATLTPPSGLRQNCIELSKTISLEPGASSSIPFSVSGRELGVWEVAYTFTKNPETGAPAKGTPATRKGSLRFAHMEPVGPNKTRPAFWFGVVAHHERERDPVDRRREIVASAFIGSKLTRSNPSWGQIQPRPDQWRWDLMDEFVDTFDELGMSLQVLLAYTPTWAADPERLKDRSDGGRNITRSAPNRDAWRQFVSTFVKRYQGRIPLWEPWNEPDIGFWRGTVEEYLEIATIALDEIHRTDPKAKVMTGGFATLKPHVGRERYNPDMQARVLRELGTRFDYHATHEHGSFSSFAQVVDGAYATLRAGLPDPVPPLFFNETAQHSAGTHPDREKYQAWALVKKSTFARSRGAAGYLWYDLRNDGLDTNNAEHNFGLLARDFQPKPVYVAFNTHARLFVPRPYLNQLPAGPDRWFFVCGSETDSSRLLVFWNDEPSAQNEQIILHVPGATRISLIDLNGNATRLPVTNDTVVVSADTEPRYVLAEGATSIEFAGRLAGPERAYFGAPGQKMEIACEFTNPTQRPLRVMTRWTNPLAMKVIKPADDSLVLAPHAKALSVITVQLPEAPAYRFGQNARLRLDYDYESTAYRGRLTVPVQYGVINVPTPEILSNREPDIVLSKQEQLHSFIDADPNLVDHRWRGPSAFSARVWLGADTESLALRVEVTDTKHSQNNSPIGLWRGDSVQCVLQVPGQQGMWEFGFADHDADGPSTMIWHRPQSATDVTPRLELKIDKFGENGEGRIYHIRIPRAGLKLTDAMLREGFRFNIAVNDHDGTVRAHALQLAPGIVIGKSADNLPYIVFQKMPNL